MAVNFFRHSASIAALMLFSLSIMSFRFGNGTASSKNTSKSSPDSTAYNTGKAFSGSATDPEASSDAAINEMFKINPKMESFMKGFRRRETEEFSDMKVWGKPYFKLMDEILAKNGLPVQLKYLCVIESNLKASTVSYSGATGPWQLMPEEGRMFGLTMKKGCDERKDYEKSTQVAAGLLKNLYKQFGDWLLVVAAYNCGNGAMRRAIAKAGSKNYWVVQNYLSEQARNHVKKYIATHYMFEGSGGWTTITNDEALACRLAIAGLRGGSDSSCGINANTTIDINGNYNAGVMMRCLFIDSDLFNRLNPGFDQRLLAGKTYPLTLPNEKLPLFICNRKNILEQSAQLLFSTAITK